MIARREKLLTQAFLCAAALAAWLLWGGSDSSPESERITPAVDAEINAEEDTPHSSSENLDTGERSNGDGRHDVTREELVDQHKAESRPATTSAPRDTVVLFGLVRDEVTRRALADVHVTLMRRYKSEYIASVFTNTEGKFRWDALPSDTPLAITLSRDGYAPRAYYLEIKTGSKEVVREFEMDSGVLIRGMITDFTTGVPVDGAEILDRGSTSEELATTDKDGRFSIRLRPMGSERKLLFGIKADGYCKIESKYTLEDLTPNPDLRITLPRQSGMRGVVRDSTGQTIPGALVVFSIDPRSKQRSSPLDEFWKHWRHTPASSGCITNDAGEFLLMALRPWTGPYRVRVAKQGYRTKLQSHAGVDAPRDVKALQITLYEEKAGARIRGILTLNGKPCGGHILWTGPTRYGNAFVKEEESGEFAMDVEVGKIEIIVDLTSNFGPEALPQLRRILHVVEGREYRLDFPIRLSLVHISGQVRFADGKPFANSTVHASCGTSIWMRARTDSDGRYSFAVPATHGPYSLSRGRGFRVQTKEGIQAGEKDVDFVIPTLGHLKFKAQEGGQDLRISFFRFFMRKSGEDESIFTHEAGKADAQGWQNIQVPPGRYDLLLELHWSSYSPVWVHGIDIRRDATPTKVIFPLSAAAQLKISLAPGQEPMPKGSFCAVLTATEASKVKLLRGGDDARWQGTRDLPSDALWSRVVNLTRNRSASVKGLRPGDYLIKPYGANIEVKPGTVSIQDAKKHTIQLRWHLK